MINNVVLVGRLGGDPEMKYTQASMPITKFTLAVDRGRKNDQGENETDWLNIVAFQKTAELVAQYCDKGSLVGVEGRIQTRNYEDATGKRQTWVEIVANNVRFLESRAEAERRRASRGQSAPAGAASAPPPPADNYGPIRDNEDPFGDQ